MPTLVNAVVAMQGSSLLLGRTLATLALQATIQGLRAPPVHRVQLVNMRQLALHPAVTAMPGSLLLLEVTLVALALQATIQGLRAPHVSQGARAPC